MAGIIVPGGGAESKGLILILPQVERRADLVADLVDRVLAELRPQLFPHAEGRRWARRAEYELPYVQELKNQIVQFEEEACVRIREREEQIAADSSLPASCGPFQESPRWATGGDVLLIMT